MATKKGAVQQQQQQQQQSSTRSQSPNTPNTSSTKIAIPIPAPSRGSMTANGSAAAIQFLSARWKAIETAANDSSIKAAEKPELHREKAVNTRTASPSSNQQQQQQPKGQNQPKSGSPWGRSESSQASRK